MNKETDRTFWHSPLDMYIPVAPVIVLHVPVTST